MLGRCLDHLQGGPAGSTSRSSLYSSHSATIWVLLSIALPQGQFCASTSPSSRLLVYLFLSGSVHRGDDDSVVRILGGGEKRLDLGETPEVGAGERLDERNGPVIWGQRIGPSSN